MSVPRVVFHSGGEFAPHRRPRRYGPELRVLIVGGGVAGLTLAALLEQRGFAPLVVEKSSEYGAAGFVIGLWPAGSRILKGLRLFAKFCAIGVECSHYIVANASGDTLNSFSFEPLVRQYGPLVDASRLQLIDLLRSSIDPRRIRLGVTVQEITERPDGVVAVFDDGSAEEFDVLVACDGIHSSVRQLVFGDVPLQYSGVAGWHFWLPPDFVPPPEIMEYWGAGKFLGLYPMRNRFCAVAAVQAPPNAADPAETRNERLRSAFSRFGGIVPWVLRELPAPELVRPIDFSGVHLEKWVKGHVVFIGDAAHAILPTTGMGASLAMESAAVLAEELCRTDSKFLMQSLGQYEERRRGRVDRIQAMSRRLGRVMFADNSFVTRLRDGAIRILADEPIINTVNDMLAERI
jgi:2-polyprenyl-6-methoxyphenol hydroxylase-like FAD-dependent oxidoreductase